MDGFTFNHCVSLSSIILPDGVTTIGRYAFKGCDSLTSIILPDGVTTIGECAFFGCYSISSLILPDSAIEIADDAFDGCTMLKQKADEAGLTIEEWGKLNWRKAKAPEVRMSIMLSIKQLQKLSDEQLAAHISTISDPTMRKVVQFLVECGEPGLVREIVKYCGLK
jgi:hypothetical protein